MKYRKMLIYLFPFIVCAIFSINNELALPDMIFRAESINIFQWVKDALQIAFDDNGSAVINYVSWLVTYSIVFEFGLIMIELVTFLPRMINKMFNKILGDNHD